jgi:hypothetical protein
VLEEGKHAVDVSLIEEQPVGVHQLGDLSYVRHGTLLLG